MYKYVLYSQDGKCWDGKPDKHPSITRKKWNKNYHKGETILKVWQGYGKRRIPSGMLYVIDFSENTTDPQATWYLNIIRDHPDLRDFFDGIYIFIYLYIYTFIHLYIYTFIYLYIYVFTAKVKNTSRTRSRRNKTNKNAVRINIYK